MMTIDSIRTLEDLNRYWIERFKEAVLEDARQTKEDGRFIRRHADLAMAETYAEMYNTDLAELEAFINEAYNF